MKWPSVVKSSAKALKARQNGEANLCVVSELKSGCCLDNRFHPVVRKAASNMRHAQLQHGGMGGKQSARVISSHVKSEGSSNAIPERVVRAIRNNVSVQLN